MPGYIKFVRSGVEGDRVQRLKEVDRWRWVVLLTIANTKTFPGLLATDGLRPYEDRDFCYFLGITKKEWGKTKKELFRVNLITESTFFSRSFVFLVSYIPNQDIENQFSSRYERTRIKVLVDNLLTSQNQKRELYVQLIQEFNIFNEINYLPREIFQTLSTLFPQFFHKTVKPTANKNENKNKKENSVIDCIKVTNSLKGQAPPQPESQEKDNTLVLKRVRFVFTTLHKPLTKLPDDQTNLIKLLRKQITLKLPEEEMLFQLDQFLAKSKQDDPKTGEPYYLKFTDNTHVFNSLFKWLDRAKPRDKGG